MFGDVFCGVVYCLWRLVKNIWRVARSCIEVSLIYLVKSISIRTNGQTRPASDEMPTFPISSMILTI
jgi:hypothetical protein